MSVDSQGYSFNILPDETVENIQRFLKPEDLARLSEVDKRNYYLSAKRRQYLKCMQEYGNEESSELYFCKEDNDNECQGFCLKEYKKREKDGTLGLTEDHIRYLESVRKYDGLPPLSFLMKTNNKSNSTLRRAPTVDTR